jgi:hypothetical protein
MLNKILSIIGGQTVKKMTMTAPGEQAETRPAVNYVIAEPSSNSSESGGGAGGGASSGNPAQGLYRGIVHKQTGQTEEKCNARPDPNITARIKALLDANAAMPSIKGLIPKTKIQGVVRLRDGQEVSETHFNAQVALAYALGARLTRLDVSNAGLMVEVKPGNRQTPAGRVLESAEFPDALAAGLTAGITNVGVYYYNSNSFFANNAELAVQLNRFVMQIEDIRSANRQRGQAFGTTTYALKQMAKRAPEDMQAVVMRAEGYHMEGRNTGVHYTAIDLGALHAADPRCEIYPEGLTHMVTKTTELPFVDKTAEEATTPAEPETTAGGGATSRPEPPVGMYESASPKARLLPVKTNTFTCEGPSKPLRDLHKLNPDGSGSIVSKLLRGVRPGNRLDLRYGRHSAAMAANIINALGFLGALRLKADMRATGTSAMSRALLLISKHTPKADRKSIQLDVSPGEFLWPGKGSAGWPEPTRNVKNSKLYMPKTTLPAWPADVCNRLSIPRCLDPADGESGVTITTPQDRLLPKALGCPEPVTIESARAARMLCPEVIEPEGTTFISCEARRWSVDAVRALSGGSMADQHAASIAAEVTLAFAMQSADEPDAPGYESSDEEDASTPLSGIKAIIRRAQSEHQGRYPTQLGEIYKMGRDEDKAYVSSETQAARLSDPVKRALINRGCLTLEQSLMASNAWGRLTGLWEGYADRSKVMWPLAGPESMLNFANVCEKANDPSAYHLNRRQNEFNTFISGMVSRLMGAGDRSRCPLATWIMCQNAMAIRLPDPMPHKTADNQQGYVPRRTMLIIVEASKVPNGQPWGGWTPQPSGWLSRRHEDRNFIWKVIRFEPHDIKSWLERPLRAIATQSCLMTPSGPWSSSPTAGTRGLFGNLMQLCAGKENRAMQHVADTVGFLFRGAGRASDLPSLIEKMMTDFGHHPITGLVLGLSAGWSGSTTATASHMTAVMSAIKSSGTTKESNAVSTLRATATNWLEQSGFDITVTCPVQPEF